MKKVYCDRCGKEVEQEHYITIHKKAKNNLYDQEIFDICPKCRDSFFGWIGGQPAGGEKEFVKKEQPKPANNKPIAKPSKPSASKKSNAYTVSYVAEVSGAPESTVRRHMDGICSTYGKDKQGRTIRYYHLTEEQLTKLVDRIKTRKQGRRVNI